MKNSICVYNNSFFSTSQTFMYHQVMSLADHYEVCLIAKNFENPHKFDFSLFNKIEVSKPTNYVDKAAGKLIRTYYNSSLNIGLKTYLKLRGVFKKSKCKAIHAHFGPRALEMLGFAKKFEVPLVVTFHGYDASQLLRDQSYVDKLPELFDYASAIIIVSGHMMENLNLEKWNHKVHLIPCSVDIEEFKNDEEKVSTGNIKMLHAGRIVGKKGVPDLIRVFSKLSKEHVNIELHIAGDGKELEHCKKLAEEEGIEPLITFYGEVSHSKIKELLRDTDIFVLNSRVDEKGDMEGTPVTLLEAMSMSKAVVTTRHAGIPYVVDHGVNGLLADEYANEELKLNIENLIQDPELRERLGKNARSTIEKKYSVSAMQSQIIEVFNNI